MTDWKQELEDYENSMGWDEDRKAGEHLPQHKAMQRLKEHLEFIVGINGYGELYREEKRLINLLKKAGEWEE